MVVPRGPITAKGLLLSCIQDRDPCIFLEPKILYRSATEDVPVDNFTLPIGKAQVLRQGTLTLIKKFVIDKKNSEYAVPVAFIYRLSLKR